MPTVSILLFNIYVRGPQYATRFTDPHDSDFWTFRPSDAPILTSSAIKDLPTFVGTAHGSTANPRRFQNRPRVQN
jgi:hypothetical protein